MGNQYNPGGAAYGYVPYAVPPRKRMSNAAKALIMAIIALAITVVGSIGVLSVHYFNEWFWSEDYDQLWGDETENVGPTPTHRSWC